MEKLVSSVVDGFIGGLNQFMVNLDWMFIFGLIFLNMLVNRLISERAKKFLLLQNRYKVPLLGLLLGVLFAFTQNSFEKEYFRVLFMSIVMSMAFYLWFLDKMAVKLGEKYPSVKKFL